jgi:riboflavin kinase / FMN adenylyltransferase
MSNLKENTEFNSFLKADKVVTIGAFDGVHLGHQAVLKETVKIAKLKNLQSLALTFYPLPKIFFDKSNNTKEILDLDSKEKAILKLGIDSLYAMKFYKEFTNISAEYFLNEILIKQFKTKVLVVGYDFRFGKDRNAGILELKKMIIDNPNFEIVVIPRVELINDYPNSTKIRKFLAQKDYQNASELLGWDYQTFISTKEIIFNKTSLVARQSPSAS